ncbi:MAG: 2-oxoglutarate oxidoreductase [Clostridiales Family XIII bacterium]|jgi:2-oxoglutarate ferredoxin oxidoreductase subunit beta|nr:2-oxoglutarate oxidoreductase [Clostridiales Family XIII bacterium]
MAVTRVKPKLIGENNQYCSGCGHGILNRLVAEVLEELGRADDAILVTAVGCACMMNELWQGDNMQAAHGRAPASATAIKRLRPENIVFTYQGDGDLSSIGIAEILHATARNEKFTTIFANNGVFGMTGGQMAPTTLVGQKTTTTHFGRDPQFTGMPVKIVELLATLKPAYLARGSVDSIKNINTTKKYIRNAFEAQIDSEGFSLVEVLLPCPTNWHLTPEQALERVGSTVEAYYPLGEVVKRGE